MRIRFEKFRILRTALLGMVLLNHPGRVPCSPAQKKSSLRHYQENAVSLHRERYAECTALRETHRPVSKSTTKLTRKAPSACTAKEVRFAESIGSLILPRSLRPLRFSCQKTKRPHTLHVVSHTIPLSWKSTRENAPKDRCDVRPVHQVLARNRSGI